MSAKAERGWRTFRIVFWTVMALIAVGIVLVLVFFAIVEATD
jgi:predicted nucleic acid-binding Zn ribbon protein